MSGRLIAVVGPSGVGKDSVIAGIAEARPDWVVVRRAITRPADDGAETHQPMTPDEFDAATDGAAFCLAWPAHGLRYGIPAEALDAVRAGATRIVNLSRAVLPHAAQAFPSMVVLHVTASAPVLARRLAARGRETDAQIARRLDQADRPLPSLPAQVQVLELNNDGPLEDSVARALTLLQPERA
ncbi:phosphonate metabolism protein/1,5-bisphosphokinase (PRPP-forming) PhnN [Citreimonas salinaria]|uniref:Ribose 1,5-bisphosphate phosphokinase PhnN n=1 Tax=Citreimonas salinaria TaxID=321339 RepID=A0A1H3ITS9_9RHOB|nr:phosphonate metabolism protein/1,5-bisphosphokinase (PRPP-forming) PhnN [Citreimonas salinaria]SDY30745.1 ribose 1,5-bisphosphokinase [Citreimonas salinaria]